MTLRDILLAVGIGLGFWALDAILTHFIIVEITALWVIAKSILLLGTFLGALIYVRRPMNANRIGFDGVALVALWLGGFLSVLLIGPPMLSDQNFVDLTFDTLVWIPLLPIAMSLHTGALGAFLVATVTLIAYLVVDVVRLAFK